MRKLFQLYSSKQPNILIQSSQYLFIINIYQIRLIIIAMDPEFKKKLIIAASIGAAIIGGLFIKNKIDQSRFQPLKKEVVVDILKKTKKENYSVYKQIAAMASHIATQMGTRQIEPEMAKQFLQNEESPLKIQQSFVKNYTKFCEQHNVKYSDLDSSISYYLSKNDPQIKKLVQQSQSDYNTCLKGKTPEVKVEVPQSLNKQKIIQIHKKLSLKRYLIQVEMFRKIRGKSQAELMRDPEMLKNIPNPQAQQQKIFQEEGLGQNNQPAAAVYLAAVSKYKNDPQLRQQMTKIQQHYASIFGKYRTKLQSNKITEDQLNSIEDELIYSSP